MQAIELELLKKALTDARDRGVRLKCIIEITNENIDYCKKLMELVEIRHLDDLKPNFILNKTKCLAITTTTTAMQERKTVPQIVHIDIMQIVEQYHQIFNTMWNKTTTTSAQDRIKEIEGRRFKPFTLDIIQDPKCAESLFIAQIQQARSEVLIAVSSILDLEHLATIGLVDSINRAKRRGVSMMILHCEDEQERRNDGSTRSQYIYGFPRSTAAVYVLNNLRDYNKKGQLRKELSSLYLQKYALVQACERQSQGLIALANLKSHGITEDRLLQLNNLLLDNNGYKDLKSNS